MAKVTSMGGVFIKVKDPQKTRQWYQEHLGLISDDYGTNFEWRKSDNPDSKGFTLWSPFTETSDYFDGPVMINFRVDDMDALLTSLKASGVEIASEMQQEDYGRFVHILDGDGNKVELWEPVDDAYDQMIGGARTK